MYVFSIITYRSLFRILIIRFESIHPFSDGNGRTGRGVLDHILKLYDFPPIYIPPNEHENYFKALGECNFNSNYKHPKRIKRLEYNCEDIN